MRRSSLVSKPSIIYYLAKAPEPLPCPSLCQDSSYTEVNEKSHCISLGRLQEFSCCQKARAVPAEGSRRLK